MKTLLVLVVALGIYSDAVNAKEKKPSSKETTKTTSPGEGKLTEKQAKELAAFTKKEALITPMTVIPGAPNRFDKSTLYIMKNFKIVQKIKDGYLITAESVEWSSGNSMDFGVAFLKTPKKLPEDILISGVVAYSGEHKYTATNGFDRSIPLLKIPAGLPLSGIRQGGDPFTPEYF